jgi:hypothetical protein
MCAFCDFIDSVTGSKRADGCNSAPEKLMRVVLLFIEYKSRVTQRQKSHKFPTDRKKTTRPTNLQPLVVSDSYGKTHVMHLTVRQDKTKRDEKNKTKKGKRNNMLENSWLTLMN